MGFSVRGRYRNKSYYISDKTFDYRFQVYACNEKEAEKILTPAHREKLIEYAMCNQSFG